MFFSHTFVPSRWYNPSYIWPPCFTHRPFCDFLCRFVPLYIIRTPIQVHTLKSFFLLHNSLLHLLILPPCLFSFTFNSFGYFEFFWIHFSNARDHLHPYAICISSFMPSTLKNVNITDFLQTIYCHVDTHNHILQKVHGHIDTNICLYE
jgi:hypothetical protein